MSAGHGVSGMIAMLAALGAVLVPAPSAWAQSAPDCELPGGTIGIPEFEDHLTRNAPPRAVPGPDAPDTLPNTVHLRTLHQTYNRVYWFALHDGSLWFKPNREITGVDGGWGRVDTPDCLDGRIVAISADDDELVALDENRRIYELDQILSDPALWNWSTRWGNPFWTGDGWNVPPGRTWHWSVVSNVEDETWLDPAGNHHRIGDGKVSHIWLLSDDGQRFTYLDPWLPRDLSYEACGPLRGRFQAETLVSSGSTLLTVNRYGDLWTRVYDFDIAGADPVFFSYAYEDQRGVSDPDIQLPGAPWVAQPKVPGTITDRISIFKRGTGVIERTLRIEGTDADGTTGFWQKDIGAGSPHPWINHESRQIDPVAPGARDVWEFVPTGEPLQGHLLDNRPDHALSLATVGPSADRVYTRGLDRRPELEAGDGLAGPDDWSAVLTDFNLYCSPTTMRVWVGADVAFDLRLHVTDTIRQSPIPAGLTDTSRGARLTVEVPAPLWDRRAEQPPAVQEFLETELDGRWTSTTFEASLTEISVPELDWRFVHAEAPPPDDCGTLAPVCNGLASLSEELAPLDQVLGPFDEGANELEPLVIVLREALAYTEQTVRDAAQTSGGCDSLAEPLDALATATADVRGALEAVETAAGDRSETLRRVVASAADLADLASSLCAAPTDQVGAPDDEAGGAAPDAGEDGTDGLPATGGGFALLGLVALGAAGALRRPC